jgi:hypothetical protein
MTDPLSEALVIPVDDAFALAGRCRRWGLDADELRAEVADAVKEAVVEPWAEQSFAHHASMLAQPPHRWT